MVEDVFKNKKIRSCGYEILEESTKSSGRNYRRIRSRSLGSIRNILHIILVCGTDDGYVRRQPFGVVNGYLRYKKSANWFHGSLYLFMSDGQCPDVR
jgi:hypothetical protein